MLLGAFNSNLCAVWAFLWLAAGCDQPSLCWGTAEPYASCRGCCAPYSWAPPHTLPPLLLTQATCSAALKHKQRCHRLHRGLLPATVGPEAAARHPQAEPELRQDNEHAQATFGRILHAHGPGALVWGASAASALRWACVLRVGNPGSAQHSSLACCTRLRVFSCSFWRLGTPVRKVAATSWRPRPVFGPAICAAPAQRCPPCSLGTAVHVSHPLPR
jgi:hypothetical protein